MKKKHYFNKRKGVALIWMLIAFSVLMILLASMVFVVRQDINETAKQGERIQTYYIALAGIDLTYAALMDPSNSPKKIELVTTILKGNSNTPITDSIKIDKTDGEVVGIAEISIKRVKKNEKNWIEITSVGNMSGENTKVTSTMRINEANTNQIVREKFGN